MVIIFLLLLNCCKSENFDYKVSISNDEYSIIKNYYNHYKNIINNNFIINKNYIASNDKDLLTKIKIRSLAINSANKYSIREYYYNNIYEYFPFIIYFQNNYYRVIPEKDDFIKGTVNWLDDEDIYKTLFSIEYAKLNYSKMIETKQYCLKSFLESDTIWLEDKEKYNEISKMLFTKDYPSHIFELISINLDEESSKKLEEDVYEVEYNLFYPKNIIRIYINISDKDKSSVSEPDPELINIPDKLSNLTNEEFIEEYFINDTDGKYVVRTGYSELTTAIEFLCVIKYNFFTYRKNGNIYIMEITNKPNGI